MSPFLNLFHTPQEKQNNADEYTNITSSNNNDEMVGKSNKGDDRQIETSKVDNEQTTQSPKDGKLRVDSRER
jgi:hypothetical protein